jgi:hypothetical protein
MFPTRILVAVDGFEETSWAVRAAVEVEDVPQRSPGHQPVSFPGEGTL